ncbi:Bgt-20469 [Blumeria graminis f. sp. tritici]|uniref:Bgt-20469 n=2 Tax=Blumeria graminis f. sp. tritici TaxID=62690 RepID=A0A381LDJ5_BLUGR|nr:Bgt-20469 [Blumeria graminis f. sp. tritici]
MLKLSPTNSFWRTYKRSLVLHLPYIRRELYYCSLHKTCCHAQVHWAQDTRRRRGRGVRRAEEGCLVETRRAF